MQWGELRMKKLIALDIDGTLFNNSNKISAETREKLIWVQQQGYTLALASGRPTAGLKLIAEMLEMRKYGGLLIGYNGGNVLESCSGNILYENKIAESTAKEFLRYLEQFPVTPIVDDGDAIYTNKPEGFRVRFEAETNGMELRLINSMSRDIHFSPTKVLVAAPRMVLSEYIDQIMAPFQDIVSFVRSTPFYLETTPKGVHKGATIRKICDLLDFDRADVIAFGDAWNDLTMIEYAGVGVAMGNACDALKKAANMVTGTNNNNGIVRALETMGI